MPGNEDVLVYVGTYDTTDAAWEDYGTVKELQSKGLISTYDAAVVNKDADGKVHVSLREKPAERGAWLGAAVGAVVGILFPPSLIASAAIGAAAGGLTGHLFKGFSRSDLKELGDYLDAGTASLVVIAKSDVREKIAKAMAHAKKQIAKQVKADVKDFEQALAKA